eukprot:c16686_g1_i1 orf=401-685(+)
MSADTHPWIWTKEWFCVGQSFTFLAFQLQLFIPNRFLLKFSVFMLEQSYHYCAVEREYTSNSCSNTFLCKCLNFHCGIRYVRRNTMLCIPQQKF